MAHTIPASIGTNAQRFYEFSGKKLILRLFQPLSRCRQPCGLQRAGV
jgi:hypothetical protein